MVGQRSFCLEPVLAARRGNFGNACLDLLTLSSLKAGWLYLDGSSSLSLTSPGLRLEATDGESDRCCHGENLPSGSARCIRRQRNSFFTCEAVEPVHSSAVQ